MAATFIKRMFLWSAGLTFTNMARLFIRLFTGVLFMSIGIRQIAHFNELAPTFYSAFGMTSETSLLVMIMIEIVCSLFIILGFLTRFAIIPPLVSMVIAEHVIMQYYATVDLSKFFSLQAGYLPIMFIGIFIFMLIAGPGKISLDYIISVNMTSTDEKGEAEAKEFELEES